MLSQPDILSLLQARKAAEERITPEQPAAPAS
jgi:hypothetical protein